MPTQDSPTLNPEATELEQFTRILAGDYEDLPDAIRWRDAFCHECEMNECVQGSAAQLAAKIISLNWNKDWNNNLICPKCQDAPLPPSPYWEQVDRDIAAYKESINA